MTLKTLKNGGYAHRLGLVSAGNYNITSDKLLNYVKERSVGKTDLIHDTYSKELFTEDVGTARTAGFNDVHISADAQFDLRNYNLGSSIWDKLWGNYTSSFSQAKAIEPVTSIPTAADSSKLYVDSSDIGELGEYVKAAQGKEESETVFLFRFALTDYYAEQAYNVENTKGIFGINITNELDQNAYLCEENVFMDFDIIDLTFYRDGVYTVIPTVSDAIDIFPDVQAPIDFVEDGLSWWQMVLMVVLGIIAVILVVKILGWLVRQLRGK